MFNKGDYVKGYESFAIKVQKMRGWVDKEEINGNVVIICDDYLEGIRYSTLDHSFGEIELIERNVGWFLYESNESESVSGVLKETIDNPVEEQKLFTIEQYERCLKAANEIRYIVDRMENCPLTPEILVNLFNSKEEYDKVILAVVNESCGN